ncbi:low molecular weight protein tyrosine phosphatase family protein [Hansschlegelia sp. KR7-227]|uniref:low molecular weight protein tyrosine phosphatase family protein n=1 Tax=Hansschlegelia sp. KR7-227 TaxID=3400914 RepID=UPI003C047DD4
MKSVLFLCSRNRRRSPTAERIFGGRADLEVALAGLAPDADEPVSPEHLATAELVFVMEKIHRSRLIRRFRPYLRDTRIICLDIPDEYEFMDPRLIALLEVRAGPHLR